MTSKTKYQALINGLNHMSIETVKPISKYDHVMLHIVATAHAMSPSDFKDVIKDLISDGIVRKKGDMLDLSNLWNPSKGIYEMIGKSGKKLASKPGTTGVRTVQYVAPGYTKINYASRILDVRFKETPEQFRRKVIRASGKKDGKDSIYVSKDASGMLTYTDRSGRKIDARAKSEKGKKAIVKSKLKRDTYNIEDMRALLKDEHWEEITGKKDWMRDDAATVREFNKYMKSRGKA